MSTRLLSADLLRRIERLALVTRRSFRGITHGHRRTRAQGSSIEFRDHRQYAPGDDLRHLDWSLLARHDRLHVKRFHDEQDVVVHLLVDASASMGFGSPTKLDVARRLAAALGWLALIGQDRVALHALGGRAPAPPKVLSGRAGTRRLLDWLENVHAEGAVELAEATTRAARAARRPGVVVLLSDLMAETAPVAVERLAAGGHQVHVLRVISPEEIDPPLGGDLRLVDSETGRDVVVSLSPRLLRLHAEALAAHEDVVRRAAARTGATLTPVRVDEPIERVLFERLARQGVLA